ncbi:MAG: hypothetical protein ABSG81_03965 [Acidimicrobiales bacterium]
MLALPAAASSSVTLGSATCGLNGPDVTLNGAWSAGTSTCTVQGFAAVQAGSTLTIPSGTTLTDTSPNNPFDNGGTVVNDGTVGACLWSDFGAGTTTNATGGVFAVSKLGTCHSAEHEIYVGGTFKNHGGYSNAGSLVIDGAKGGASFTNYCGSTYSETGTVVVVSGGELVLASGCPQTISFTGPGTGFVGGSYTPSATASSDLPVSFGLDTLSSGCTLMSGTVDFTGAGTCLVDATQLGNGTYAAATPVQVSTVVTVASLSPQTISFPALPDVVYGTAPFAVTATASSELPVALASLTPAVCQVTGSTVTLVSTGTCTVQATQPGNTTFEPAAPVDQSFSVEATVRVYVRGGSWFDHGARLFVALRLVDVHGRPVPDSIEHRAGLDVSFDGGTPVRAVGLPFDQGFLAVVPTSWWLAPGPYSLTVTSTAPSVPITPTVETVRVFSWDRKGHDGAGAKKATAPVQRSTTRPPVASKGHRSERHTP